MRKLSLAPMIVVILSATFMGTGVLANSEKEEGHQRWLKLSVNAPYALFGALLGRAELSVGERISLFFHLGYIDNRLSVNSNIQLPPVPWASGRIGTGVRFYVHGRNMSGFYLDGNLETDVVGTFSGQQENLGPPFGRVGPLAWILKSSVDVGHAFVTSFGLSVDVDAGLEIQAPVLGAPDFTAGLSSPLILDPVMRLHLGWAF